MRALLLVTARAAEQGLELARCAAGSLFWSRAEAGEQGGCASGACCFVRAWAGVGAGDAHEGSCWWTGAPGLLGGQEVMRAEEAARGCCELTWTEARTLWCCCGRTGAMGGSGVQAMVVCGGVRRRACCGGRVGDGQGKRKGRRERKKRRKKKKKKERKKEREEKELGFGSLKIFFLSKGNFVFSPFFFKGTLVLGVGTPNYPLVSDHLRKLCSLGVTTWREHA